MTGYKRRNWMAYLQVSASGPEFSSILEDGGRFFRPRMAADLEYTTADVDYLESHFSVIDYDSSEFEQHHRLVNPTCEEFFSALDKVKLWLAHHSDNPDWDGGGFQLCFAGHGCEGQGELVLEDGVISSELFLNTLANIASEISPPGKLRISLVLDSCHSGAFATDVLEGCLNKYKSILVPYNIFASCMDDEISWEDSALGHVVFTYCFSIRSPSLDSLSATAIQPDNSFGPSIAIAAGAMGCSLLTGGAQNPISYSNGAGHLDACGQSINLFEGGECMSVDVMREKMKAERDKFIVPVKMLSKSSFSSTIINSDENLKNKIRSTIRFIQSHQSADNVGNIEET